MITTIVLVRAEPSMIPQCAAALAGIDGVTEVYSVSGEWDLVCLIKVAQYEEIAHVVTEEFPKVPGLQRTTTLTAFRAYSKRDIEGGFSIGAE